MILPIDLMNWCLWIQYDTLHTFQWQNYGIIHMQFNMLAILHKDEVYMAIPYVVPK